MAVRFRKCVLSIALILLLTVIASSFGAAQTGEGVYGQNRLASSEADGSLLVIAPASLETFSVPPKSLHIPMLVVVPCGGTRTTLEQIVVNVAGSECGLPVSAQLEPQEEEGIDIIRALEQDGDETAAIFAGGWYNVVKVDLSRLPLQEGSQLPVRVCVHGTADGSTIQAQATLQYSVLALPQRTGWYGGDGHIHTEWSDAYWVSLDSRANYAADNGFKWLVITDHEDGIGSDWSSYVDECDSAQSTHEIPVCPGVEITATTGGDCLGYWMDEDATRCPYNNYYNGQTLINLINQHQPPYSYSVIAHPYHWKYPWGDWEATGFRCIELLSQETTASTETIDKWFELLRNDLASTINNGTFVVGLGSSDCHNLQAPGFAGFMWIQTSSYSSSLRTPVWDAIRKGRVSASGLKDLGCFALNNYVQGSVIHTSPGSSLTFKLVQQPVTGRECVLIQVYDKNQNQVKGFAYPGSTETFWNTTAPSEDTFYVVKFTFKTTQGEDPSEVWANPVFVDV